MQAYKTFEAQNAQRAGFRAFLLMLCALPVLAACSSNSESVVAGGELSDPIEGINRSVFAFNEVVDSALINPTVKGYRAVVPKPARSGLHNFLTNLKSPVNLMNQVLQGDVDGAGNTLLRTTVNTFVGLGGIFDVAGAEGYEYESEDFGQTLGVWGVGHGPYVVVPVFGPSSLRDHTGYAVDGLADPLRYYLFNTDRERQYWIRAGAEYLDLRDSLHDVLQSLQSSSIDYYATVRSTYYQNREALTQDLKKNVADAKPAREAIPDYDDDF